MATKNKHCVHKRMGAFGVSEEAQEVLAAYKRAHFSCLIGQKTYDEYMVEQRRLYNLIRELEYAAYEGGADLDAVYARVR